MEFARRVRSRIRTIVVAALPAAIVGLGLASSASAGDRILSTATNATLGGLGFQDGDLAEYDPPPIDTATLFFNENLFSTNTNIDAFYLRPNGHYILSTSGTATLGGLTFRNGDLVDYDPVLDTATLFFNEDLFSETEDINAVHLLANGHIILSVNQTPATLGGLTFRDGDLVEYDPGTDTATLFFSEDLFVSQENVEAVHVRGNGHILIATLNSNTLGGLTYVNGDVVDYDPVLDTSILFHDHNWFSTIEKVDAFYEAELTPLTLIKTAFWPDGTPIPTGATIPSGVGFKFLLYTNNFGIARSDVTVRDVLDPAFQYQAGSIQVDNSVAECAAAVCTAAEEQAIFTAVDGAAFLSDAVDGDVASYTGASSSVDAGNGNAANLQLDINADAVWAILFSVKMP